MNGSYKRTLEGANFGSRVAEDEGDDLHEYFVKTEQWRKLYGGEVDVVFGAKGAGKSALYALLVSLKDEMRLGRRTVFLAAENPRGTPVFRDLVASAPTTEEDFRGLWKLYFLSIATDYIRLQLQTSKRGDARAAKVITALVENGLLIPHVSLLSRLKAALEYIRQHSPVFEGAVVEPVTGIKLTGKITISEPSAEQSAHGFISVDALLNDLNAAFQNQNIKVWLLLDRLDVAFSDSPELEANALRSLFRTYLDMRPLSNIQLKIFLRDDIWAKIVAGGFREASHVTRTMNISWDNNALLNLIVRRLLSNPEICELYNVHKDQVLENVELQKNFFYRVFPAQVEIGQKQPATFDWMFSRTADGSKRTAPRELIHLLNESRDEQLKLYELGNLDQNGENLFSRASLTQALPAVSRVRYEQTLCAEHPGFKQFLDRFEREKTQQTPISLAKLWKCSVEKASETAELLAGAGFFERRGTKDAPIFWVPFLYRDALNLVQGAA
jgi:hypothetical protein